MLKTIDVLDSVEKEVVGFGNGSIVYTPKKWIGKSVLVVLERKPMDVGGAVLEALKPHLCRVEGIFLFWSHARGEQTAESDIDVLVICDKRIPLKKVGKFDFLVNSKEDFISQYKTDNSLYFYQILAEAEPIMNESLLEELKRVKPRPDFKAFLESTLGAFKSVHELLEAYRRQGKKSLDSNACIYSLVLRMRTLYLFQCFHKKRAFSSSGLRKMIECHGFSGKKTGDILEAYRAERDHRKPKSKILLSDAEKLFSAAKLEFLKTEGMLK